MTGCGNTSNAWKESANPPAGFAYLPGGTVFGVKETKEKLPKITAVLAVNLKQFSMIRYLINLRAFGPDALISEQLKY